MNVPTPYQLEVIRLLQKGYYVHMPMASGKTWLIKYLKQLENGCKK